MARPLVLDTARVKENCFSLSFIPAPSCQSWWRASTDKFCRFSGGFAPSPRPLAGGSGRAARQCASSSEIPGQAGPEEASAGQKPAFKPARKTTVLSRLAHTRNPRWGPRRHRVRTYRAPDRPEPAGGACQAPRRRRMFSVTRGSSIMAMTRIGLNPHIASRILCANSRRRRQCGRELTGASAGWR